MFPGGRAVSGANSCYADVGGAEATKVVAQSPLQGPCDRSRPGIAFFARRDYHPAEHREVLKLQSPESREPRLTEGGSDHDGASPSHGR